MGLSEIEALHIKSKTKNNQLTQQIEHPQNLLRV
jgi:hypothetical protein